MGTHPVEDYDKVGRGVDVNQRTINAHRKLTAFW